MSAFNEYKEDEVVVASKRSVLDKKGLIILIVSLILAITSIVTGIILFDVDEVDYREPSSEDYYYISTGSSYTYDVDSYEYVTFEFSSYYSGNYLIKINGAEVYSVKDNYGYTLSTYSEYGYSYDEVESVYLNSYTTYKVRVYTGSNYDNITIRVDYY